MGGVFEFILIVFVVVNLILFFFGKDCVKFLLDEDVIRKDLLCVFVFSVWRIYVVVVELI